MPSGRRGAPKRRSIAAAVTGSVLLVSGCASSATAPSPTASDQQPLDATFEEAALIALGEMFQVYGADADPLPVKVTGDIDTHDGRPVWRLDGTYEITVDGERQQHAWTLWIGRADEAQLAVVEAEGPR
jgi:hypothetical protein